MDGVRSGEVQGQLQLHVVLTRNAQIRLRPGDLGDRRPEGRGGGMAGLNASVRPGMQDAFLDFDRH